MPKKILLVDDSATSLVMNRVIITKKTPHEVMTADNGPEGLKLASSNKPDLILLDVMMPGMDGLEVCRNLRKKHETSRIPIVLLTYRSGDDIVKRGYESGCTAYLNKPLEDAKLLQTITDYLGDK
jgi:twitching motility two-component system response regulator PilH